MDFLIFQVPMLTLQATLDGVLLGILFALIAYGMALQWGVMNIINIAQGDLVIYMKKSKLGRAIRATAQNARAAKILGVDTEKVYAATFGINAALCGVAGALIAITFTIHPYMGLPYTIRSFMIVIVAGLGNLPGVALSGMGLGVFEEFADYILGTEFRIGSVFLLLVLILVYRRFKLSRKREYLK